MILNLICICVWLTGCGVCYAVGFFVGKRFGRVRKKATVDKGIQRLNEREQRELLNMLTYDGTPQIEFVGTVRTDLYPDVTHSRDVFL